MPCGIFFALSVLLILTLSSSLRLLLALYAGLLIMLSLTKLGKNTALLALSLETTKCAIESLVFFNSDLSHFLYPPLRFAKRITLKILLCNYNLIIPLCQVLF